MSEKKENVHISARLTAKEKAEIDEYCEKYDYKIAQLIRRAVKEYMDNHPNG